MGGTLAVFVCLLVAFFLMYTAGERRQAILHRQILEQRQEQAEQRRVQAAALQARLDRERKQQQEQEQARERERVRQAASREQQERAAEEERKLERITRDATRHMTSNGNQLLRAAHPTASFSSLDFEDIVKTSDGYKASYDITYKGMDMTFAESTYFLRMHVYLDDDGHIVKTECGRDTSPVPPGGLMKAVNKFLEGM